MDPFEIINTFYRQGTRPYRILVDHGRQVAAKATAIAARLQAQGEQIDIAFVNEAALLHDIGMFMTATPKLGCHGQHPYIRHGLLGRALLQEKGYPRHALVCERHVGTGLSAADIERQKLPLPVRDMRPVSLEEEVICFADKFFSKDNNGKEKSIAKIRTKIADYGTAAHKQFDAWVERFL